MSQVTNAILHIEVDGYEEYAILKEINKYFRGETRRVGDDPVGFTEEAEEHYGGSKDIETLVVVAALNYGD